jgi:hypothetical protein
LHGPPPQPTQVVCEPSVTPVRVKNSPAPSDEAVMNFKSWRRDERRASTSEVFATMSGIAPPPLSDPSTTSS